MKTVLSLILLVAVEFSFQVQDTGVAKTNEAAILTSHGFRRVVPSQAQTQTLDKASENLIFVNEAKAQIRTIDQAVLHLWRNINIAVIQTARVCAEYRGFFWFSRLDSAAKDDETFRSGFAVKRGTGEIYRWEDCVLPSSRAEMRLLFTAASFYREPTSSVLSSKAKGENRAPVDIQNGPMKILCYGKPWSEGNRSDAFRNRESLATGVNHI